MTESYLDDIDVGLLPLLDISRFWTMRKSSSLSPRRLVFLLPHTVWCEFESQPIIRWKQFFYRRWPSIVKSHLEYLAGLWAYELSWLSVFGVHFQARLIGMSQHPYLWSRTSDRLEGFFWYNNCPWFWLTLVIKQLMGFKCVRTSFFCFLNPWLLAEGYRCMLLSQLSTEKSCASFGMLQVDLNKLQIELHEKPRG